ncbi:uncharacterized protein LOC108891515 isoform X2 [Lates calcarifer]|uniref:Uncharacterized protein LOC108891515 isoform X2 n=1 Tax=Lates calcarifer TaxID=8187 RepID=A0AAJ8DM52_LATCA|nr:uncharacterized protein LOC108891515 isoform X2 [Lates calcarifer]
MSRISMKEWKTVLTSILKKLDQEQYRKLQKILNKLPPAKLTAKYKENMPQTIIEYYAVEESISAIKDAMDQIPRNDPAVQDLLRPFVNKLKKKQEKNKEKKRKHESDSESEDKKPKPAAAQQSSSKPEERKSQLWIDPVEHVETSLSMTDKQEFKLKNDTDEIRITLWGEEVKQLIGKSRGDYVRVTNVRPKHLQHEVLLSSSYFTKISKVQRAAVKKN